MTRYRLKYVKGEGLRFTGNLDMHKVWERTFRRADLNLAYSQGYHPQPRIQQAFPVPLGIVSLCNYLDFWLDTYLSPEDILKTLIPALHPSIQVTSIKEVEPKAPPLQTQVSAVEYTIFVKPTFQTHDLAYQIESLMSSSSLLRERRGKTYDLRKLIHHIDVQNDIEKHQFIMKVRLSALPGATGRPEEVIDALGIPPSAVKIELTNLFFLETIQER